MDDWLEVPKRRKGLPVWLLCLLMGAGFLLLWLGFPLLAG